MKKVLIIHHSMEIGGAESSLLGLLQSIDYSLVIGNFSDDISLVASKILRKKGVDVLSGCVIKDIVDEDEVAVEFILRRHL